MLRTLDVCAMLWQDIMQSAWGPVQLSWALLMPVTFKELMLCP